MATIDDVLLLRTDFHFALQCEGLLISQGRGPLALESIQSKILPAASVFALSKIKSLNR